MTRPRKCCRVALLPGTSYFKPAGIPLRFLEEVCLTIEEMEAVRLRDIQDLEQAQCARQMNISRTTFQRVLESARKKIADALVGGKAIKIEGGHFEMACPRTQAQEAGMPGDFQGCRLAKRVKASGEKDGASCSSQDQDKK